METSGCIPTPRAAHSMVLLGKKMIVFGGRDITDRQNDCFQLDLGFSSLKQAVLMD